MADLKRRNDNPTPWSYQKGSTLLHRLPAGFKLIFLLLLSLAVFIPGSPFQSSVILSGTALILIILSLIARKNPLTLPRGSGPLLFIVLAVFLLRGLEFSPPGINFEGLEETVIFGARMVVAFCAGNLLFSVTTPWEIRKSLSRLELILHLDKLKLSLGIPLMLAFLKVFFVIWEDLNLAWKARGGGNNLKRLVTLMFLSIEKMMKKAAETAAALDSRATL